MKKMKLQKVFFFFFFYGEESEQFVQALEFIRLSPINREFAAFFAI